MISPRFLLMVAMAVMVMDAYAHSNHKHGDYSNVPYPNILLLTAKRSDPAGVDGLTKVIKSHYYRRPARSYIPTMGYMAPAPYEPIPFYHTEPYTSGDSYLNWAYIPRD